MFCPWWFGGFWRPTDWLGRPIMTVILLSGDNPKIWTPHRFACWKITNQWGVWILTITPHIWRHLYFTLACFCWEWALCANKEWGFVWALCCFSFSWILPLQNRVQPIENLTPYWERVWIVWAIKYDKINFYWNVVKMGWVGFETWKLKKHAFTMRNVIQLEVGSCKLQDIRTSWKGDEVGKIRNVW